MSLVAYASETTKAIKVTLKINQKYKGVNKLYARLYVLIQ